MNTGKSLTFEQWQAKVNAVLVQRCGLGVDDLPDWGYWEAWDSGVTFTIAANRVLKAAQWSF